MSTTRTTTLLEREHELAVLGDALSAAKGGDGRIVLFEAPAGLGKTSLLKATLADAAEAGFDCLTARAGELERDFAYGCVRQLFEMRASESDGLFAGAAALSKPLFAPAGDGPPKASPDTSFQMLHGLHWLVNNLSNDSSVVLAIDDLHWADAESLRFLTYLAPRLDGLPVLVVASTRPGEGDVETVSRLATDPQTTVLRPAPLTTEAAAIVCEQVLAAPVEPEFADACRDATGGNPFFLEALLREVRERGLPLDAADVRGLGPQAIAQAVRLRLSNRPAAASLVRAIAVLGDGASVGEAAALAELSTHEAARNADLLVAYSILADAERIEFAHPIVREAVYGDLGPRERAELHARAAHVLEATGAAPERIAAQIAAADPAGDPERVELLRAVAAESLAYGAPSAAAAWLTRAVAEPPPESLRGEVLLELSMAKLRLGAPEAAVDDLTAASQLITDPVLLTTAGRLLGGALTWSGQADRAVDAMGRAIDIVAGQDRELALLLEADRAAYAQQAGLDARGPVRERLERYAGLRGDTPGERLVLAALAYERARASESAAEAAAHIAGVLAGDRLVREQETDVAGALYLLLIGLLSTDELDVADACLEGMLAHARDRASLPAQAFVIVHRGWFQLRRGAVARAEEDARTALDLLTTYEIQLGTQFALALLIRVLIEAGQVDDADKALREGGVGDEIPPGMATNALLESRGLLRVAQGRASDAVADLSAFGRNDELFGGANPLGSRWRSHAALAGDPGEGRELALEDLDRARRWGAASGIGVALRAAALTGDPAGAVDGLRDAAATLAKSPDRLEHARALTDLGAALRRSNQRADAREPLGQAIELADACGARAVAERARTELRAAGGQPRPAGGGFDDLTVSERRVAELAADGLSNPEIAQTLFVTRKTVETHLGRVYRKLGIPGRAQLSQGLGTQRSGT